MVRARLSTLLIAALASTALAGTVQATTITQADLTQGANSVTVGGFTVTTTGNIGTGSFDHKTGGTPAATGVGVAGTGSGSVVGGEIDNNEKITFTSISGQHLLTSFEVAFLFPTGFQGDTVNEIALLGLTGPSSTITLTPSSTTTATLSGASGTVTNESIANNTGAGEWLVTLTTPLLFTNLVFQPGDGGTTAAQGDFAFVSLTVSAVPEPSTWAMMILGFFGVGFMAYRRKATKPTFRLV